MRTRILIVDGDADDRSGLAALLQHQGHYVEVAEDGLEAVQRARLGWFDIVLMEYDIAEVDGAAAARLITDLTSDHGSPVMIALTRDPVRMLARVPDAGRIFHAVMAKPCDGEAVLETILRCLAGAGGDAAEAPGEAWPAPKPQTRPGRRVLLVEDDAAQREVLTALLLEQGFDVEPAMDGLAALLLMGTTAYDVAILDYDMPKMNGVATARLVHDLIERADRPRLLALTANAELVRARDGGGLKLFDRILQKSGDLRAVIKSVGACC
jgi:CheY-like chemotaxis protein